MTNLVQFITLFPWVCESRYNSVILTYIPWMSSGTSLAGSLDKNLIASMAARLKRQGKGCRRPLSQWPTIVRLKDQKIVIIRVTLQSKYILRLQRSSRDICLMIRIYWCNKVMSLNSNTSGTLLISYYL